MSNKIWLAIYAWNVNLCEWEISMLMSKSFLQIFVLKTFTVCDISRPENFSLQIWELFPCLCLIVSKFLISGQSSHKYSQLGAVIIFTSIVHTHTHTHTHTHMYKGACKYYISTLGGGEGSEGNAYFAYVVRGKMLILLM